MSSAAHKLIDYLADAVRTTLGVRELIDLDTAILGGERRADQIADELGIHVRTVERRKAKLRERGRQLSVPECNFNDSDKAKLSRSVRVKFLRAGNRGAP